MRYCVSDMDDCAEVYAYLCSLVGIDLVEAEAQSIDLALDLPDYVLAFTRRVASGSTVTEGQRWNYYVYLIWDLLRVTEGVDDRVYLPAPGAHVRRYTDGSGPIQDTSTCQPMVCPHRATRCGPS